MGPLILAMGALSPTLPAPTLILPAHGVPKRGTLARKAWESCQHLPSKVSGPVRRGEEAGCEENVHGDLRRPAFSAVHPSPWPSCPHPLFTSGTESSAVYRQLKVTLVCYGA